MNVWVSHDGDSVPTVYLSPLEGEPDSLARGETLVERPVLGAEGKVLVSATALRVVLEVLGPPPVGKVLVDEQALRRELEYFGSWCFWDECRWSGEGSQHTGTCPLAGGDQ